MTDQVGNRLVVGELGVGLGAVFRLVVQEHEDVVAIQVGCDVTAECRVPTEVVTDAGS